ncbi:MAG: DUF5703 domain-containing protein [Kiritimatiellaeota bacterium]|nr:DUF5703 domain-containing protein [Kiritimatiellota bacterium]
MHILMYYHTLMNKMAGCIGLLGLVYALAGAAPATAAPGASYNLVWDSPSQDENGSMPIGNGDLAANVWMEPNGDLVFYLSKSDAWSGNERLLKLGRVRVRLDKPFILPGATFRQELDLESGTIRIHSTLATRHSTLSFWIDAYNPVVNVQIEGSEAFTAEVLLELWRTQRRQLKGNEMVSARALMGIPEPVFVEPDTVAPAENSSLRWYHRNEESCYRIVLENQHLGHLLEKYPDPLMKRTFGCLLSGEGLIAKDDKTLVTTKPAKNVNIRIHALTAQTDTAAEWLAQIAKQRAAVEKKSLQETRQGHEAYWAEFWSRSHIHATGTPEAEIVSRAYALQRWMQACAGRGKHPIKFNGSLFTVAANDRGMWDADYRRWGGNYWFQNTRLAYWPMLYSGDYDQMEPFWRMYRDDLPLLKDRTRKYYDHDGIFCSETMYFWGTYGNTDFGWGNKGVHTTNPYIRYYWDSGIELSMMMLDYYRHTRDESFVKTTLLPIADGVVTFYDKYYKRNAEGKVHFSPAMSLETWHKAEDPLPVIVGLQTVLTGLLDLPGKLTGDEQRQRWQRFRSELPPTPFGEKDGKKWIEPARVYSDKKNSENPELYAVFPYRAYGLGKPDLEVALETWRRRAVKRTGGWTQDPIQAALLGLSGEAKKYVVQNAKGKHAGSRFPAFWGPNFDWIPDQDHGSVTMIALQRMLMQCDGKVIRLLPAWPKEWDADFKLHAPYGTVVQGRVGNGRLVELKVTPAERRKDVIVMTAQ